MVISERELKKLKIDQSGVHYTQFCFLGLFPGTLWVGYDSRESLRKWCRYLFTIRYHV